MLAHAAVVGETAFAFGALVEKFARVRPHVTLQQRQECKCFITVFARMGTGAIRRALPVLLLCMRLLSTLC